MVFVELSRGVMTIGLNASKRDKNQKLPWVLRGRQVTGKADYYIYFLT